MNWSVHDLDARPRVAILASKQGHCLGDLLVRFALGEMPGQVVCVVSNHATHGDLVVALRLAVRRAAGRRRRPVATEHAVGALLDQTAPDVVVLARYMRILPEWLVERWAGRIINIHHSFLPSFVGARPYAKRTSAASRSSVRLRTTSRRRSMKDPIIAQQVMPVSHRDDPARLERRGRDLEAMVLAEAVRLHLEHRVIVYGRRTAVFDYDSDQTRATRRGRCLERTCSRRGRRAWCCRRDHCGAWPR